MSYITKDRRVIEIVTRFRGNRITKAQAAAEIKALPPQQTAEATETSPARYSNFGYLDWEVEEALKSGAN